MATDFEQRDAYANPANGLSGSPAAFMGPGQDVTPYGYIPQYGSNDPTALNEMGQEFGMQQALNAGQIGQGLNSALNQNNINALLAQLGYNSANQQVEAGALNSNYNNQLAQLGLKDQGIGIQQGALARQGPLADLLHSIAGGRFDLSRLGAWQGADVANRQLTSNAISQGANTSIGYNQHLGDVRNQLANQLKGIDYSALEEGAQYGEKKADIEDQGKLLDLQANQLGLDRDQLKSQLDIGLQRLGISTAMNASDLVSKMNSSNIQEQMAAFQIFNQAIQNSDYYSQFYPGYSQLQSPSSSTPLAAGISAGTGPSGSSSTNPNNYGGALGGGINFG